MSIIELKAAANEGRAYAHIISDYRKTLVDKSATVEIDGQALMALDYVLMLILNRLAQIERDLEQAENNG